MVDKRFTVLDDIRQLDISNETAKEMAKEARKHLSEGILLAKCTWSSQLAVRIHDMANYPKNAWKAVITLKEWLQGYHKTPNTIRLKKSDKNFTEPDLKFLTYFQNTFIVFMIGK